MLGLFPFSEGEGVGVGWVGYACVAQTGAVGGFGRWWSWRQAMA